MKKKRLTDLSQLAGAVPAKKKKKDHVPDYLRRRMGEERPAAEPEPEKDISETEELLFMRAMQGVEMMEGDRAATAADKPKPEANLPEPDDAEEAQLRQFMKGNVDFELEFSEEYMHGYVHGLDSKIFQQLKAGGYTQTAHLDLHGLNAEQAYDNLLFFVRENFMQGNKHLLIVTGRGRNSPGGLGVLKREIQSWLTREPLKRIVLAFCTAQPRDGGAGALYLLLRNRKKTQGKVKWDRTYNWDEEV